MELYASEEQRLVAQTVAKIVEKTVRPRAGQVDREGVFPWEAIRELAGSGFLGLGVPAEYGGSGAETSTFAGPGRARVHPGLLRRTVLP
ncbi:MAG: acyl-CoA dehydrogenase family protein [Deltaproteobacteria bacterium]|nr:acyl-CoA dehydrogenase family protein [Deltaproteobacteria bacterium]